jgi:hypothetical protein
MLRLGGWLLLLGLVAGGWLVGEPMLRAHLEGRTSASPAVSLLGMPEWMPPVVIEDIQQRVRRAIDGGPLDQTALQDAAHELRASAWVQSVTRIIRRPGGLVEVQAAYRIPTALIESAGPLVLVDDQGVRLPLDYDPAMSSRVKLPVIRGVRQSAPPSGDVWKGDDLQAGLRLARLIATQPWIEQVRAVDVSNFSGRIDRARPHLVLVTARGQVRWGRAPGDEQFFEPPAAVKLENLHQVVRKFKSIDANGRTVDVHSDAVLIHPEAATAAAR